MREFLQKSVDTVTESLENTWRNIVVGSVMGGVAIFGITYGVYTQLYISVEVFARENTSHFLSPTVSSVRGVKEYIPSIIGGDILDSQPIAIPHKREMFIPFDMRQISAAAVMVKDVETGTILFGSGEYDTRSLASVTKLMSAMVMEEYITDWDAEAVSPRDPVYDSLVFPGTVASIEEWFRLALVVSSNRAVLTIVDATGVGRESFVTRMNEKARELGMANTVFTDPTGIDAGNQSNASDTTLLLTEALRSERIVEALMSYSLDHGTGETKKKTVWNTNQLLTGWVPSEYKEGVIGKTGYILESEYNFVGKFTDKNKTSIIVIVFGSRGTETRFTDAVKLAEWTFQNYVWSF
jgi:D-alanyl-D-alanine endopeptidase (penicillin-binding protein 7)